MTLPMKMKRVHTYEKKTFVKKSVFDFANIQG